MTIRRPKPPQNAWLIEQRKRRGWKPEDVAARMDVAVPTVRGWESGRGIGPESMMRLEALFGVAAPGHDEPATDATARLAAAIEEQNELLKRVIGLWVLGEEMRAPAVLEELRSWVSANLPEDPKPSRLPISNHPG